MNRRVEALLTPAAVLRVVLYGAIVFLFTRTFADADLWGHVRFGIDMITGRAIPAVDTYSFTSDIAWVNHEWLAEVFIGAAYLAAGNTGLVVLKLLVATFVGAVLISTLRAAGWRGRHLDLVLTLALIATFFRLQYTRPQLFSVACFTGSLLLMREYERDRRWSLWLLPPLFVLWVNTHGGFVVGLGVLALWAAFAVFGAATVRDRLLVILAVIASILATLLNPYGFGLWRFIRDTVGLSRPEILDWIPLWRFPIPILLLELMLPVVVLVALVRAKRVPPARNVAIAGCLGVLMLKVSRIDIFFQISLAILLLPFAATPSAQKPQTKVSGPLLAVDAVLVTVLVVLVVVFAARNLSRVAIGAVVPDRDALVYVRDQSGARRVLTWYNWGQYAIWHLAPRGIRVSMDGRRETVYSDRVVSDYFRFYRGEDGFIDYPRRIGADAIWLPAGAPVLPKLTAAGWQTAYSSGVSVVLLPAPPRRVVTIGKPDRGKIFPGP